MTVASPHRGYEIEAGSTGIAGLDAVDALDITEQVIVIADRLSVIGKCLSREVAIVARKAVLNGAAQCRLVSRGRHLRVVRQTGGVAIGRAAHAECAGLAR